MTSTPVHATRAAEPLDFSLVLMTWSLCVFAVGLVVGWILGVAVMR